MEVERKEKIEVGLDMSAVDRIINQEFDTERDKQQVGARPGVIFTTASSLTPARSPHPCGCLAIDCTWQQRGRKSRVYTE